jgi:predicted aminopeptidase
VLVGLLSGCSSAGYYAQSVRGQMEMWNHSRPIRSVLADPEVADDVKDKLRLALEIRSFAVDQLHLPDNDSYTEFVDLRRSYAVWSVFAAPELSLLPQEWCFLVVGCVTYRGYFDKQDALDFAQQNADEGYDVYVGGVPAYSTLGWFDDPIPNTILNYRDEEFAGLIFHELAHQVAFAKGDTVFNESFATTVERIGVGRWLTATGNPSQIDEYRLRNQRNQHIVKLILDYRAQLDAVYASDMTDEDKRQRKQRVFGEMKGAYAQITRDWPGYSGYRYWFDQPINNAQLLSVATYSDLVPAFEKLLDQNQGDLTRFYAAARDLVAMEKPQRRAALSSVRN